MKRINTGMLLHSLATFLVLVTCSRSIIKDDQLIPFQSIWHWHGNNQRSGYIREDFSSKPQHQWTYKATAAVGTAITAADQFLFLGTKDGRIIILDIRTGKSVRSLGIKKRIESTCLIGPRYLIILQRTNDPTFRYINLTSGKTTWKRNAGDIDGEPLLIQDRMIIGNAAGEVMAIQIQTGKTLWEKIINGQIYNSMAQYENTLIAATDNGNIWSMNSENGKTNWNKALENSIAATPVLDEKQIYIGTREGALYALSQLDGSIQWKYKTKGGIYQTAAVAEDKVYFGTSQGILYCLDCTDGSPVWQYDTNSVIGTSPLITNKQVIFGTLDRILYMLNRITGELVWQVQARGRIRTTPLIWKNWLIFASEDRYIYGFSK
jgi:outer membrane protein assembly factor BamB